MKAKKFYKTGGIDPSRLEDVSDSVDNLPMRLRANAPTKAYVDRERGVVVQVWENDTPGCNGTPWEGTYRVAIGACHAEDCWLLCGFAKPVTWDDMQAIKDFFWPERIAIEIYPPHDKIVDVADMRWMWVLPKGAVLPFNLQGTSPERLES